jgi:uncharacterized protein YsxB (DUF464 family)
MVRLEVLLDRAGCLRKLSADGHAGYGGKGQDIVCAAATAVVRTACRVLERAPGFMSEGAAPREGTLRFEVTGFPQERRDWFSGVTEYLLCALSDLAEEFPDRVRLTVRSMER